MQILETEKNLERIFWVLEKIAFELFRLNTHIYRVGILVIRIQYGNKQSQDLRYY